MLVHIVLPYTEGGMTRGEKIKVDLHRRALLHKWLHDSISASGEIRNLHSINSHW